MRDFADQLDKERRKVDFDTFDFSVKELVAMACDGIINVAPEYQRQFRWPAENQSRFIESVFLGIPVPSLFMAANKDGTWELIDGVQRLSTLIHYMGSQAQLDKFGFDAPLKLEGLESLSEFNGCVYNDIPSTLQLKFSLRPLKVTTLSDKSDLKVRFDLFERLNTGGIILTKQEIRGCVYRGEFNDFLSELSKNVDFERCVNLPESRKNDGTKQELVLKFFAFLNNRQNFDHSVVDFLNDYMSEATLKFNYKKNRNIFEETFRQLSISLPDGIKRGNRQSTPINLFEAVSVGAADAINNGRNVSTSNVSNWINDKELTALTSGATNSRKRLSDRIRYCFDRF
ncbi:DUF262 domain-containing protein [Serratia marcescens]|uniref:DUF262 domain-containing protein n=1 Tax=Serratia marcescens TaxID=615 RepID=UPI0009A4F9DA|nr:DUF262 domain-containing protein [Serratia marcescens]OPJ97319.1 hypothetical protein B1H39_02075 [Serratia marcescens]CAI1547351.1 Uncharacterized conserved protein [Serratia marcescens]